MSKGLRCLALTAALTGLASTGWGQWTDLRRSGMSVGGHWSYVEPENGSSNNSGGANLRFYGRYVALDVMGDYRKRDVGPLDIKEFPLGASLLFYFLDTPVSPYAMAGGNWIITDVRGPGGLSDTQHRFGWHVGGGAQMMLSPAWSVDAAYRRVWIERIEGVDLALTPSRFNDDFHWVTVGLNFHFGGAR